jgi:two-component system, NtrC family, response regulator AtoC
MQTLTSLAVVAHSRTMMSIFEQIDQISASDGTVLLIGETGVGKELFAEYIHRTGSRADFPFIKVGLSALPPELLESELFGHERGAYTSANAEKKGLFELAHTGSIFLDDIDDFPLQLQSKLLRILESREMMRVGGTISIPIDTRVICATKVDLKSLVESGRFRSDLYYRINVVPIVIPPLRERREDIPLLIEHFLKRYAPEKTLAIGEDALKCLTTYQWPGNVRELRNVVQRVALFSRDTVRCKDLPPEISQANTVDQLLKACYRCFTEDQMSMEQVVACLEVNILKDSLKKAGGNRSQAAKLLKMSLSTFRDKLKKYNLNDGSDAA